MKKVSKFVIFLVIVAFIFSCATKEEIKPPPAPAKIALVLGAGASKGFAHIGVLKMLEANKIPIHMVVGTSAGSFVGSIYAYGYSAYEIQKLSFSIEKGDIIDLAIPDNGFIRGEKLESYINRILNNTPLEKLKVPFYVIATDIQTGSEMVFGTGNSGTAVRASCSVPGIFRPVNISGRLYVDGGVVSPVAVDAARRLGADVVIAVDISSDIGAVTPQGTMETILQSISVMYAKLAETQLAKADIVIRPKVGYIGSADFTKRHEAVLEGEKAAIEVLPQIQELVNKLKEEGRLN